MNIIKLKGLPSQGLAGLAIAGLLFSMIGFAPSASADTTADISASITPTSVNSGATQEFDISVTNGASASSSIGVITVSEALVGWTIDTASISCPFAWTISSSSADGFTCVAGTTIFGSADIDPGNTEHVTFTATAPTVTVDTDTIWNLYFQDSDGGESNTPDVHVTIIADVTPPPPIETTAIISVSITPTTVNSGATQEFDMAVSNGVLAGANIDAIIVTEAFDFGFNSGSIECPTGWSLSSTTPENFTCVAGADSTDIGAGSTGHVTFTATAPVFQNDTETLWNLWFGDSEGGESNVPDAHFTILATTTGTTTPPTGGGNGGGGGGNGTTTSATSSPTITINGDATVTAFSCNPFNDLGASAVSSAGVSIAVTSNSTVNLDQAGTYTIVYTATDAQGNTSTATRTVIVEDCGSGGGGGSSAAPSGAVLGAFTSLTGGDMSLAVPGVFPPFIPVNPGMVLGAFTFPFQFVGQVLGAFSGQVLGAFVSDLSIGDRGPEVVELQTRLTMLGYYSGPITGYFGQLTKAAVIRFQAAHGLPSTGFVGPLTRQMLNS